ncbi:hypothetical protein DYB32_007219 [Aphanomyces invadans]|uniref:Uncharacterized protein n=1 Tax=Aphanomyces invadans TaxID=157072 RepID=A0A3R7CX07_9STRA|nr:hypothetical protein DYB32_007219 [Aphanomyces invadans]
MHLPSARAAAAAVVESHGVTTERRQGAVLNYFTQSYDPVITANELAEAVYKTGEGKWSTDEATFFITLLSIPPLSLRTVAAAYVAKHRANNQPAILYRLNVLLDPIVPTPRENDE